MKLSTYSEHRIRRTLNDWCVAKDYADPLYNYLVHGFGPGSFFTAVLANDFTSAIRHSHPSNTINALKDMAGWINNHMPLTMRGSYDAVSYWIELSDAERRAVLEKEKMIFTEKEETWIALKGKKVETI